MLALGRDAGIARLRPKDWLANFIIAGTVDEEAKKELMKIDNPDMEKVKKAQTHTRRSKTASNPQQQLPKHSESRRTTPSLSHAMHAGRRGTSR